jgi:hypothetical protein
MKRLLPLILLAAFPIKAQDTPAKACDKLPYRLGHLTLVNSTDLRDKPRAATKKESKELERKITQTQAACNAFARQYPGHAVSKEFSYEVKGLAAYLTRCESFCGTEKELSEIILRYGDEAAPPQK